MKFTAQQIAASAEIAEQADRVVSIGYASQEESAVQQLLALGVRMGEPVALTAEQQKIGHVMCAFHLIETATGEDVDGASASTILSLLTSGTYGGQPSDYTLHRCTR